MSHGHEPFVRAYLRLYFFDEFQGRGLPALVGLCSALTVLGDPNRGARQPVPSVATDYNMALSGYGRDEVVARGLTTGLALHDFGGSRADSGSTTPTASITSAAALDMNMITQQITAAVTAAGQQVNPTAAKACDYCERTGCAGGCNDAKRAAGLLRKLKREIAEKEKKKAGE